MRNFETELLETKKINTESFVLSEEDGFVVLPTESVSSKVFIKDGKIFKLTSRDSLKRQSSDYFLLKEKMKGFEQNIAKSKITECIYENNKFTCVEQDLIDGKELKILKEDNLNIALKENKEFLLKLLDFFFESIKNTERYPDIVGYPKNQEYSNTINMLLENGTGKIILCDVGLSPHEDTLQKFGEDFYNSKNVKDYVDKMKKFKNFLDTL